MKDFKKFKQKYLERRKIFDKQSMDDSKAFCMMPWVHLYVSQFGTVVPCCVTPWDPDQALGNVNKQPISEIWNGAEMKRLRAKMLKDKKDKRCWQCYENEANGLKSHRKVANFCYDDKLHWVETTKANGFAPDSKPIYWDIRISNLCNFKCRICGHHSSTKWYDDAKELGETSFENAIHYSLDDFEDILGQLEEYVPHVEEVYFAGGEPMLMEEHYRILDILKKHKRFDIKLRYSTNFSITEFKGRDVFQDWKEFKDVNIHASLDGTDKRGELQRNGQVWSKALENRKRLLRECPHAEFFISSTLNVFNVLHLPDFHRQWVDEHLIYVDDFMPHTLKNPEIYNIKMLPKELKQQVMDKYTEHLKWLNTFSIENNVKLDYVINEFENCLTHMNSEDWSHLIPEFVERSEKLDALRGENTRETFPELAPLFN